MISSRVVKKNTTAYKVDGEVGRFEFETYSMVNFAGDAFFDTSKDFFVPLQGKENYQTAGFKEVAMIYGSTEVSFRKGAALINRIRHQEEGGTPSRTLKNNTEHEGKQFQNYLEETTQEIFKQNGFTLEGLPESMNEDLYQTCSSNVIEEKLARLNNCCDIKNTFKDDAVTHVISKDSHEKSESNIIVGHFPKKTPSQEDEELAYLINSCESDDSTKASMADNPVIYEGNKQVVQISIDDVLTKKQKEKRDSKDQESNEGKKRQYVPNTVIHVQKGENSYHLNGFGVIWTLQLLLAFLLNNQLLGNTLVFFVDGHSLYSAVLQFFPWHKKISLILDWFHLEKKCKERLSMALKGSELRNLVLEKLMPLLWNGLVDQACNLLEQLPQKLIRNQKEIQSLVNYLKKNKPMIPVYAIRKKRGLRNSSNPVEKANDLLVANRQKHQGMAWSLSGSVTLASLTVLKRNQEYQQWFRGKKINFKLVA